MSKNIATNIADYNKLQIKNVGEICAFLLRRAREKSKRLRLDFDRATTRKG